MGEIDREADETQKRKWDLRGLYMARHVSKWSKDPSTKVGAVIMTADHRPVSWGYNGLPAGMLDTKERLEDRETKLALTIHAERNAILFARGSLLGGVLYVWPFPPCSQCAADIAQSGIRRVVVPSPALAWVSVPERWERSFSLGRSLLLEVGIDYHVVTIEGE